MTCRNMPFASIRSIAAAVMVWPLVGDVTAGNPTERDAVAGVRRPANAGDVRAPLVAQGPANEAVVVRLPDDSLRIFFVDGGSRISSMTSTNGGLSWAPKQIELELPGTAYHAVQVLLDRDGELHVVFHIAGKGNRGYAGRHYNLWHARTSGRRKTWGEPKQFFEGYVGALRCIAQLAGGRIIVPFARAAQSRAGRTSAGTKPSSPTRTTTAIHGNFLHPC